MTNNETIEWQKNEAYKLYNFIQKRLNFDDLIVKLPNEHQLSQLSNITIKKLMNYCVNKLNEQQGQYFDNRTDFQIQGYLDENDTVALMNVIYLIVTTVDNEIKRNLNQFYRMLVEIVKFYEIQVKDISKINEEFNKIKQDFINQEKFILEANKLTNENKENLEKLKTRFKEFVAEAEKIMKIEEQQETEERVE